MSGWLIQQYPSLFPVCFFVNLKPRLTCALSAFPKILQQLSNGKHWPPSHLGSCLLLVSLPLPFFDISEEIVHPLLGTFSSRSPGSAIVAEGQNPFRLIYSFQWF